MKKGYEVVWTSSFWLAAMWVIFGLFDLIENKLETTHDLYFMFSVGVVFFFVAALLEVNGKYLKDIRDSLEEK